MRIWNGSVFKYRVTSGLEENLVGYPSETIAKGTPFNPFFTFECGQAFRWKRLNEA